MRIVETDTNESGHENYMLEKDDAAGTLIVAIGKGNGRYSFRYLLTGKAATARDTLAAARLVNAIDRERRELWHDPGWCPHMRIWSTS